MSDTIEAVPAERWIGLARVCEPHWELHENGKILKCWPAGAVPEVWLWVRDDGTAAWMETERDAVRGTEIHWIIAEAMGPQW